MLYIACILGGATLGGLIMSFIKGADYPCEDCVLAKYAETRARRSSKPPKGGSGIKPAPPIRIERTDNYEEYSEEFMNLPKYENIRKHRK